MVTVRQTTRNDGYFDQALDTHIVSVIAGHYNWTTARDIAFSTMLGSCLAVCACDKQAGIGGMNHFLLPEAPEKEEEGFSASFRYGSAAIEGLLNSLYKEGAAKNGLTIKIFGGGQVLDGVSNNIGQRNVEFARRFFSRENLRIESEDVGGDYGRRIVFFPHTGKVLLKQIGETKELEKIAAQEKRAVQHISHKQDEGNVELF